MITFDTTLDIAVKAILSWDKKEELRSVKIIRDVMGKVSFLFDNERSFTEEEIDTLKGILEDKIEPYYSGKIYFKKLPKSKQKESKLLEKIIDLLENPAREWREEDGIQFYVSERTIAKKAWINCMGDKDSVWTYEEALAEEKPKVITFYSFKGGMGRTTTLAAVALTLASMGKSVMMIDTDIEAPGLASLFLDEDSVQRGVLDYLLDLPIHKRDMCDYVRDITDPVLLEENDGNLYLLPAGKVDKNYLQKLARIDYQDNRENYLRSSLENMLQDVEKAYDVEYILIDARAGFHDMGGIAVSQIPHGSVLIGNNTRQSWEGMEQVLKVISEGHREELPVLLIDTMCERNTSLKFAESKKDFENRAYTACLENYYMEDEFVPGPDAQGVAHAPEYIPFNEELQQGIVLYSTGSAEQDAIVKAFKGCLTNKVYQSIAERIMNWFGGE